MSTVKTFSGRHGAVTITEEGGTFVVVGSSGYRATLPTCRRDDCEAGRVRPCATPTGARGQHAVNGKTSVAAWLDHSREFCHAWHWPSVERFAGDVLKTYGAKPTRQPAVGVARGAIGVRHFARVAW
ncbi:hypothetical protein ACFWDN_21355 [Micromonospora chalcea]